MAKCIQIVNLQNKNKAKNIEKFLKFIFIQNVEKFLPLTIVLVSHFLIVNSTFAVDEKYIFEQR